MTDQEIAQNELARGLTSLGIAGAITETSLEIAGDVSFDRWEALGAYFGRVKKGLDWWIGDWMLFGESTYGEDSAQAVESTTAERYDVVEATTGIAHQTLKNLVWICRSVPPSRRRAELPVAVHAEVAKLEPEEQKMWLGRCVDGGWSRSRLREEIRAGGDGDGGGDGGGRGPESLTHAEALEVAARVVWQTGQPAEDGATIVPAESWAQLGAALGETD